MDAVNQLAPLADLFGEALARLPAIGGHPGRGRWQWSAARGRTITTRVIRIDVNPGYLAATRERFPDLRGLELLHADLEHDAIKTEPVALVHAALVFEYAGTGRCPDSAVSLVAPEGHLSVVLQIPTEGREAVTPSGYPSMNRLADGFSFIDPHRLRRLLAQQDLRLTHQSRLALSTGKTFWSGYFERK